MKRLLVPALLLNALCLLIRIAQEASPPPVEAQAAGEVILDNGRPGTSFVGSWTKSSAPSPFGTESLYNSIAGNSYTWQLALPASGEYEVYAWWTVLASRAPAAPYVVTHAGGTSTVTKDQRSNGGKWNLLGKWSFTSSGRVQVRTTANFSTSADAIRFVRVVPPAPTLTWEEKEILSHFSIEWLPAGTFCQDPPDPPYGPKCEGPTEFAKTIRISGVNLQVYAEERTEGIGNLIIGPHSPIIYCDDEGATRFDACQYPNIRTGNHNLILGNGQSYSGEGGIVAGFANNIEQGGIALGGSINRALQGGIVIGGEVNGADGSTGSTPGVVIGGIDGWAAGGGVSIASGDEQNVPLPVSIGVRQFAPAVTFKSILVEGGASSQ